jgi:transposase
LRITVGVDQVRPPSVVREVAERQMLRPSFVPPQDIRELRDLTRYRVDLVGARTAEKQRVEKLLEDAGIKLSVVASDIFGVSGRDMLAALTAGDRDPVALAEMARGSMRGKRPALVEALTGRFTDHHGYLLSKMLARVDAIDADLADLDATIGQRLAPFARQAAALAEIPGLSATTAAAIIAEIGVDMSRFPTAGHLASWARFAPGVNESAGRKKGTGTGKGNRYLARSLGEVVIGASRTPTFLGARYRRIAKRRTKKVAMVAVGRSILVIIWHLLSNPDTRYRDLGPDFYDTRLGLERATRNHVRHLQQLGFHVTLEPAA